MNYLKTFDEVSEAYNKPRAGGKKRWSVKYKKVINCSNPKGFSQKQFCKRKRKGGAYKNESSKWWEKVVDKNELKFDIVKRGEKVFVSMSRMLKGGSVRDGGVDIDPTDKIGNVFKVLLDPTDIFAPFILTTGDDDPVEPIVIGAFPDVADEIFTGAIAVAPVFILIAPDLVVLVPIFIIPVV
jgi:hypothetical protein